jgi:hypothetical protein
MTVCCPSAADDDADNQDAGEGKKKRPAGRVYTKREREDALMVKPHDLPTFLRMCLCQQLSFWHDTALLVHSTGAAQHAMSQARVHCISYMTECCCCCCCCLQVHRVHCLCMLAHALVHDTAAADKELQVRLAARQHRPVHC